MSENKDDLIPANLGWQVLTPDLYDKIDFALIMHISLNTYAEYYDTEEVT